MKLLEFVMPPFARIQWASKQLKDEWEPKFEKSKGVFNKLELLSVVHGLRSCTTTHISPNQYLERTQELAQQGLVFMPIEKVGTYAGSSNYHPKPEQGKPWAYYGVISSSNEDAKAFVDASKIRDHRILGRLLGYPECCIEFFELEWKQNRFVDPVWQQSQNTEGFRQNFDHLIRLKENDVPWELNSWLRPFSIGPFFHKLCSYNCEHSLKNARSWLDLGRLLEVEGIEEMEQIMKMPMEWDCLKGIAYVRSPLFKVSYNSNPSTTRFIVQREGSFYPDNAPKALTFPWNEYFSINQKKKKVPSDDGKNNMG